MAAGSDENIVLTPPVQFTLEQAIEFLDDDELVEITPNHIRLRKKLLTENERNARVARRKKTSKCFALPGYQTVFIEQAQDIGPAPVMAGLFR